MKSEILKTIVSMWSVISGKYWKGAELYKTFKGKVWTDAIERVPDQEELGECKTVFEAAKNPLFIKWLTILMRRFCDKDTPDIYKTDSFWEETFFPQYFAENNDIVPLIEKDDSYKGAYELLNKVFSSPENDADLQRFLKRVFSQWNNTEDKKINSIFRYDSWKLDSRKVAKLITNIHFIKQYDLFVKNLKKNPIVNKSVIGIMKEISENEWYGDSQKHDLMQNNGIKELVRAVSHDRVLLSDLFFVLSFELMNKWYNVEYSANTTGFRENGDWVNFKVTYTEHIVKWDTQYPELSLN